MKGRAKTLTLIALCLAVLVLLLWQRSQITKLNQHNADLRAQLDDAQHKPVAEQPEPATPPSPNPELLRLRAEVAELRRQKVALARNASISSVEQPSPPTDSGELPFETRVQHNTWGIMRLVLAMRLLANEGGTRGGGKVPVVSASGELLPEIRARWEKFLKEDDTTVAVDFAKVWPDVELLVTDAADLDKLDGNTIVARTVAIKTPSGKWTRVYAFADGSAHRRVHDTPDEVWQATPP
jgi:hypothetical protein